MVKAASVARGQLIGELSSTGHVVQVPAYVAFTHMQACYAFDSAKTADCSTDATGDTGGLVSTTTTAGLYNPIYYALVGWPTVFIDNELGIYAMRVLSGILSSLFVAFAFLMVSTWRSRALPLLGLAVAITPMVLFLGGSVNPNGVEATATLALFVGMLSIVLHHTPQFLAQRAILLSISAIAALNTRGLSPLWVGLAIVIPLFLLTWRELISLLRKRAILFSILSIGIGAILALAWLLGSNSLGVSTINAAPDFAYPGTGGTPLFGFTYVLEDTFRFSQGIVGIFGWLDTPAPLAVYFLWAVLVGGLLLAAATLLKGRALAVAITLTVSFLVFPALIQAAFVTSGGLIWQGRYNLPLFVCLVFGLASLIATSKQLGFSSVSSRFSAVVLAAVAVGQMYAYITAIRRYAVGYTGSWKTFLIDPAWTAPGGNMLWLAATAAILCVSAFLLFRALGIRHASPSGGTTANPAPDTETAIVTPGNRF